MRRLTPGCKPIPVRQAYPLWRLGGKILSLFLLATPLLAAPPAWWSAPQTQVLDTATPGTLDDNYAPANLGQLKNVAKQAKAHLDARLPGGAGIAINDLVSSFEPRSGQGYTQEQINAFIAANYAPINLGQLKAVAKPFYDRLLSFSYDTKANLLAHGFPSSWTSNYPWNPATAVSENYAPSNLGQVKAVFSFDLANFLSPTWQQQYFGQTGIDPAADPDGDGMTNLQEYQQGSDPNNYFSQGGTTISPTVNIVAGNFQMGADGTFAGEKLSVEVRDELTNTLLVNAPLAFKVEVGTGKVSESNSGAPVLQQEMAVRTDANGRAEVYFQYSGIGKADTVTATATPTRKVTFWEYTKGVSAQWDFEEASGATVLDASVNGNNGTLVNDPARVTGLWGNALEVDGVHVGMSVANATGQVFPGANGPFTISMWFKPAEIQEGSLTSLMVNETYQQSGFRFSIEPTPTGNRLLFHSTESGGEAYVASESLVEVGKWTHGVVVYDGSGVKFYVNGILEATDASGLVNSNANPIMVGYGIGGKLPFKGLIDKVQIFYGALSDADVAALADQDADGIQDADGDGLSNLAEYQQGSDPNDYYNGQVPYLEAYDGNDQNGTPGAFAANPLTVWVGDRSTYQSLSNAPVTFTVFQGGGGLSPTTGSSTTATLQVRTDSNGYAQVYYQEPTGTPIASLISATAGTAQSLVFVSFNGSTTVGDWKFDEGTGTAVSDSSGAGNNGSLQNNVVWSTGLDGNGALQFDGQSGYVQVPNSGTFNIGSGPMTVMAWVRLASQAPLLADTDIYNIIYKGTEAGTGIQFALAGGPANGLVARIFSGDTCQQVTPYWDRSPLLADGNWHHVAFARDENGIATLFIDGSEVGYQTAMSAPTDSPQPLWIGRGESDGYFNGTIDNVALWRSSANYSDIANLYNHDSDANGLADWWEVKYFGSIGQDPTALTQRGDGTTLLQACLWGYNPFDYYNGVLPTLTIVSGGDQRAAAGTLLTVPLSVAINHDDTNAPITFTVTSGNALISAANGDTPSTSVSVRSINTCLDPNGYQRNVAQVYICLPNSDADLSVITATATSETQTTSITTTASTTDPTLTPPTDFTATPTSSATVDLAWTPSDVSQPTTIQGSYNGGASWFTVGVVAAGESSATITGMTPDISVNFRAITGNCTDTALSGSNTLSMPSQSNPGGGGGTGGGSAPGLTAPAEPLSQPMLMGENRDVSDYMASFAGFLGQAAYSTYDIQWSVTGFDPSTHLNGSREENISMDPDTSEWHITKSGDENIMLPSLAPPNQVVTTYSDTFRTQRATGPCDMPVSWPAGSTIFIQNTLSAPITEQMLLDRATTKCPAFQNIFSENKSATAALHMGISNSYLSKLQYKFKVNKDPNGVVVWDVTFIPDDGSDIKHDIHSWQTNGVTESPVYTVDPTQLNNKQNGVYQVVLVPVDIAVDANRDGVIKFAGNYNDSTLAGKPSDKTTEATPFRFWVNDGHDGYCQVAGETTIQDALEPTDGSSNYEAFFATCERDLENFARLHINIGGLQDAIASGNITIGLEWHSNTGGANDGWGASDGAPAIHIYSAAPNPGDALSTGGSDYLTDPASASAQVHSRYGHQLAWIEKGRPVYLPASAFENLTEDRPNAYFLFEGAACGTGRLVVTFNTGSAGNYTKIGEGGALYLDLKNIKELYERWTVGDGNGGTPSLTANVSSARLPYSATALQYGPSKPGLSDTSDPNGNKYILFVHGWNLPPWERDAFAETAFKRLYWQGYKGKFGAFQWPTTYGSEIDAITGYDDGEYTAWQSAVGLETKLADLRGQYDGVYVLAHSMGNVVVGEALRKAAQDGMGQVVTNYLASQAAVPVHCYDPNQATPDGFFNSLRYIEGLPVVPLMDTPNIYKSWLAGNSVAISGSGRLNFFNVNDYALSRVIWESDQALKPDIRPAGVYYYASFDLETAQDLFKISTYPNVAAAELIITSHTGIFTTSLHLGSAANVQDRYEIMAYDSEPRCRALGATSNASGFGSTDLQALWGHDPFETDPSKLFSDHPWHSAQFRFTYADQKNYWNKVLDSFLLLQNK